MKIVLPSTSTRFNFPYRIIGYAGRYDTISDCAFLDDTHLVCVDRQMARMYLLEFNLDTNDYTVLNEKEVLLNGTPHHFELIYINNNTVYSVDYTNRVAIVDISNMKFDKVRWIELQEREAYHGITGITSNTLYVTNMMSNIIREYDLETTKSKAIICQGGVRMKAISFIDEDTVLVLSSDSGPKNGIYGMKNQYNTPYNSHILVYNRHSGKLYDTYVLEKTQIDACVVQNEYCYVTCTDACGNGYILRCKITPEYRLTEPMRYDTDGFPHGIDIHNGLFSYTSYSESSVHIKKLSDIQFR
jgi:hypothetical protein